MDFNLVKDITSSEAFLMLKKDSDSNLVDVRTEKEIFSVGFPDLDSIGKTVSFIEWNQSFFSNSSKSFLDKFREKFGIGIKGNFMFICKSGIRSNFAALTVEESYNSGNDVIRLFNIVDGFEGNTASQEMHNKKNGWKFLGLPWKKPE